jgi:hypothetical protein
MTFAVSAVLVIFVTVIREHIRENNREQNPLIAMNDMS